MQAHYWIRGDRRIVREQARQRLSFRPRWPFSTRTDGCAVPTRQPERCCANWVI